MIPLHLLTALLPPGALAMPRATSSDHDLRASLEDIRRTISAQIRQARADLGGHPEVAEEIYRIVNSSIEI